MTVEFAIQAAAAVNCASKDFETLAQLRDFLRSHIFSATYHVRGPERQITTSDGFVIGYITKGLR